MNLQYIECYLTNLLDGSPDFVYKGLKNLLVDLKEFQLKEKEMDSIYDLIALKEKYNVDYQRLVTELAVVLKTGTNEQKVNKISEILCNISSLIHYYQDIVDRPEIKTMHNFKGGDSEGSYVRTFMTELNFFKEQRTQFVTELTAIRELISVEKTKNMLQLERMKKTD